jgi:DNA polymerase V
MERCVMQTRVQQFIQPDFSTHLPLTLFSFAVPAGYPSPSEHYIEGKLDLNEHLIKNPTQTFYVTVTGDSMSRAGIKPGATLIIDRAIEPRPGKIVIAIVNGEITVKRLKWLDSTLWLVAEPDIEDRDKYPPIAINECYDFEVWGVVTAAINKL